MRIKKGILCLLVAACLMGCGDDKPNDDNIKEDLKNYLQDNYETVSDFKYEITRSFSEEKYYEAFLNIQAKGRFADFEIEGTIYYTKYDQGWKSTSCILNKTGYIITSYPDSQELYDYIMKDIDEREKYEFVSASEEGDQITIRYLTEVDRIGYTFQKDFFRTFIFSPESETWVYDDNYDYAIASNPHLIDISGEYDSRNAYGVDRGKITFSDVTDNSFTVSGEEIETPITFVFMDRRGQGSYIYVEDDNYHYRSIKFWFDEDTGVIEIGLSRSSGYNQNYGSGGIEYVMYME